MQNCFAANRNMSQADWRRSVSKRVSFASLNSVRKFIKDRDLSQESGDDTLNSSDDVTSHVPGLGSLLDDEHMADEIQKMHGNSLDSSNEDVTSFVPSLSTLISEDEKTTVDNVYMADAYQDTDMDEDVTGAVPNLSSLLSDSTTTVSQPDATTLDTPTVEQPYEATTPIGNRSLNYSVATPYVEGTPVASPMPQTPMPMSETKASFSPVSALSRTTITSGHMSPASETAEVIVETTATSPQVNRQQSTSISETFTPANASSVSFAISATHTFFQSSTLRPGKQIESVPPTPGNTVTAPAATLFDLSPVEHVSHVHSISTASNTPSKSVLPYDSVVAPSTNATPSVVSSGASMYSPASALSKSAVNEPSIAAVNSVVDAQSYPSTPVVTASSPVVHCTPTPSASEIVITPATSTRKSPRRKSVAAPSPGRTTRSSARKSMLSMPSQLISEPSTPIVFAAPSPAPMQETAPASEVKASTPVVTQTALSASDIADAILNSSPHIVTQANTMVENVSSPLVAAADKPTPVTPIAQVDAAPISTNVIAATTPITARSPMVASAATRTPVVTPGLAPAVATPAPIVDSEPMQLTPAPATALVQSVVPTPIVTEQTTSAPEPVATPIAAEFTSDAAEPTPKSVSRTVAEPTPKSVPRTRMETAPTPTSSIVPAHLQSGLIPTPRLSAAPQSSSKSMQGPSQDALMEAELANQQQFDESPPPPATPPALNEEASASTEVLEQPQAMELDNIDAQAERQALIDRIQSLQQLIQEKVQQKQFKQTQPADLAILTQYYSMSTGLAGWRPLALSSTNMTLAFRGGYTMSVKMEEAVNAFGRRAVTSSKLDPSPTASLVALDLFNNSGLSQFVAGLKSSAQIPLCVQHVQFVLSRINAIERDVMDVQQNFESKLEGTNLFVTLSNPKSRRRFGVGFGLSTSYPFGGIQASFKNMFGTMSKSRVMSVVGARQLRFQSLSAVCDELQRYGLF